MNTLSLWSILWTIRWLYLRVHAIAYTNQQNMVSNRCLIIFTADPLGIAEVSTNDNAYIKLLYERDILETGKIKTQGNRPPLFLGIEPSLLWEHNQLYSATLSKTRIAPQNAQQFFFSIQRWWSTTCVQTNPRKITPCCFEQIALKWSKLILYSIMINMIDHDRV
jgi:hypothetical protein